MIEWLKPNQAVVCIDDSWLHPEDNIPPPNEWPIKDRVYIIHDVQISPLTQRPFIALAEITPDYRWLYSHFRPSRTTDISSLTSLTTPPPQLKTLQEIEAELVRRINESIERVLETER